MSLDDPVITVAAPQVQVQPAPAASGIPPRFSCFVPGTDTEIGKTLVSSAMLYALVQAGVRACGMKPVAAGAELRDGRLHDYFGIERSGGLAECLAGALQPHQAVRHGVADHLDFIPCGSVLPQQTELLQHRHLASLLESLSARYDVVLMTAPPVLAAADALVVGAHAGAVFLVTRSGVTTEAASSAAT